MPSRHIETLQDRIFLFWLATLVTIMVIGWAGIFGVAIYVALSMQW